MTQEILLLMRCSLGGILSDDSLGLDILAMCLDIYTNRCVLSHMEGI